MRSRLQGVVSPETFLRFGPPQNKLQDIGANVIWDDLPGVPLQSKVLLHGNDRLTIANIPFDMAYNNLFSFGGKKSITSQQGSLS
ncbi:hypothetical protein MKQ70_15040 [Chitinophaga sedimenti]|uniref:hypothetical protein n=1 Tax=Chitinophaga sedimenti TaxID=2033606 RepID=UPI0020069984|nr:hypothetical protein [Chitinophaga sedimenti]MCK7556260.1 hypothetical protein [Chitinophaga sedimenti]